MRLLCELFNRVIQNTTRLTGACIKYTNLTEVSSNLKNNSRLNLESKHLAEDQEAAIFIIVVICFYSLSIVFMVIINIKLNVVIDRNSSGGCYCWERTKNDLYETQRDETKNTIHMIFNDSSKLLTSGVIPSAVPENVEFK